MSVLPRRRFPRSDDQLSIIGFGGIVVMNVSPGEAANSVARAVDRGVNYFDVAPSYGNAQERLGPAMEPHREKIFLACKTAERTREGAERELHESLRMLKTDWFDLYQLHGISDVEKDVKAVFRPGGVMEFLARARDEGVIRHLGFSAHSEEAAWAAMDLFDFDSVLFPINYTAYTKCNFGPRIVKRAEERNMARLALKAMARGKWEENDPNRANHPKLWYEPIVDERILELALRYTLSQPVTAALPPGQEDLFFKALEIGENFRAITAEEIEELDGLLGSPVPIFGGGGV